MNFSQKLKNYALYRRLTSSFILITAITILTISVILFFFYSRNAIAEIQRTSISILDQTSYAADIVYEQVKVVGTNLMSDNLIFKGMNERHLDKLQQYQIVSYLSRLKVVYPFIRYLGLVNKSAGLYLNTEGISYGEEIGVIEPHLQNPRDNFYIFFPRLVKFPYDRKDDPPEAGITFILYPNNFLDYRSSSFILIHIDREYLLKVMKKLSSGDEEILLIFDSAGGTIAREPDNDSWSEISYRVTGRILRDPGRRGFFIDRSKGLERFLYCYTYSSTLAWYFVRCQPLATILPRLATLRNVTILSALVLFIIGTMISAFFANKIYMPVERLISRLKDFPGSRSREVFSGHLNEIDLITNALDALSENTRELRSQKKSNLILGINAYLRSLVTEGRLEIVPRSEVIRHVNLLFAKPCFRVIRFRIDRNWKAAQLLSIRNQIRQSLDSIITRCLILNTREIVSIINYARLEESDLLKRIELAQAAILREHGIQVSAYVGTQVTTASRIAESYGFARSLMCESFFNGPMALIHGFKVSRFKNLIEYPKEIEKRISEAVRMLDRKLANEMVTEFYNRTEKVAFDYAIAFINELHLFLLKEFEPFLEDSGPASYCIIPRIQHTRYLKGVVKITRDLCMALIAVLDTERREKNNSIVLEVKTIIEGEFDNFALNSDLLADRVGYSSGYLRRIFRIITGRGLNEYICDVRMEEARELLLNTDKAGSAICRDVGFQNVPYFFTLFKKKFGLPPALFREKFRAPLQVSGNQNLTASPANYFRNITDETPLT